MRVLEVYLSDLVLETVGELPYAGGFRLRPRAGASAPGGAWFSAVVGRLTSCRRTANEYDSSLMKTVRPEGTPRRVRRDQSLDIASCVDGRCIGALCPCL